MIGKRMGVSTIAFEQPPMLSAWAAVGGKKEQEGHAPYTPRYGTCVPRAA